MLGVEGSPHLNPLKARKGANYERPRNRVNEEKDRNTRPATVQSKAPGHTFAAHLLCNSQRRRDGARKQSGIREIEVLIYNEKVGVAP